MFNTVRNSICIYCIEYFIACANTPGWTNGAKSCKKDHGLGNNGCTDTGFTCERYEDIWCWGGGPKADKKWTLGPAYNFPENHCCSCGKGLGT